MSDITVLVDLRHLFGPVRNQGGRPTCLAFAASDAHAALRGTWTPLSCEYAFYHAQRRANRPPNVGTDLSSMLASLKEDGQPDEIGWPYLAAIPKDIAAWRPPSNVGQLFGRSGTAITHSVNQIIQELNAGRCVLLLTMLSQTFYQGSPLGIFDPPPGEGPEPARRHAVVAVGHGNVAGQRAVLVRNSWGNTWGSGGYGWLTHNFLAPRIYAAATLLEEVDVPAYSHSA